MDVTPAALTGAVVEAVSAPPADGGLGMPVPSDLALRPVAEGYGDYICALPARLATRAERPPAPAEARAEGAPVRPAAKGELTPAPGEVVGARARVEPKGERTPSRPGSMGEFTPVRGEVMGARAHVRAGVGSEFTVDGVAEALAAHLRRADGIAGVAVGEQGILAIALEDTVGIAAAVVAAGHAYGRSRVLDGTRLTASRSCAAGLATAPTNADAIRLVKDEALGRIAEAAGADVTWTTSRETAHASRGGPHAPVPAGGAEPRVEPRVEPRLESRLEPRVEPRLEPRVEPRLESRVEPRVEPRLEPRVEPRPEPDDELAELVAWGEEPALRYVLVRTPDSTASQAPRTRQLVARCRRVWGEPAFEVRYACAHTAMTLRHAAELGITPGEAKPGRFVDPAERVLLKQVAELPDMVARAARRRDITVLTRHLEVTAKACQRLADTGRVLPRGHEPVTDMHRSRVLLTAAVRTTMAAGLAMLGVAVPERM